MSGFFPEFSVLYIMPHTIAEMGHVILSFERVSTGMSEGIPKPWLLDYLIAYAEAHASEILKEQRKRGKVQIINVSRVLLGLGRLVDLSIRSPLTFGVPHDSARP